MAYNHTMASQNPNRKANVPKDHLEARRKLMQRLDKIRRTSARKALALPCKEEMQREDRAR
jgi:hypothetical protein